MEFFKKKKKKKLSNVKFNIFIIKPFMDDKLSYPNV